MPAIRLQLHMVLQLLDVVYAVKAKNPSNLFHRYLKRIQVKILSDCNAVPVFAYPFRGKSSFVAPCLQ